MTPRRGGPSVWVAVLLLFGCSGPKGATPIPEPPSLDPTLVSVGLGVLIDSQVTLEGQPGATSGDATIRAINLDSRAEPAEADVDTDGSFTLTLDLPLGAEVRVQPARGDARGASHDWLRAEEGLVPPPRHACVRLTTDLLFAADGREHVRVENDCASAATILPVGVRLGLPDFTLPTDDPLTVAPGARGALAIEFARQDPAGREDVLFFQVSVEGVERRHPVTVFARER